MSLCSTCSTTTGVALSFCSFQVSPTRSSSRILNQIRYDGTRSCFLAHARAREGKTDRKTESTSLHLPVIVSSLPLPPLPSILIRKISFAPSPGPSSRLRRGTTRTRSPCGRITEGWTLTAARGGKSGTRVRWGELLHFFGIETRAELSFCFPFGTVCMIIVCGFPSSSKARRSGA